MFFAPSKLRKRAKIWIWVYLPKSSDHINIKIKMPNPSQEPPASSKAPNRDLKDMDVLRTFKINLDCLNLDQRHIKKSDNIPKKIKISNIRQEIPESIKSPFKIKGHLFFTPSNPMSAYKNWSIDLPYSNLDQYAKLRSETLSILQSPNKDIFK